MLGLFFYYLNIASISTCLYTLSNPPYKEKTVKTLVLIFLFPKLQLIQDLLRTLPQMFTKSLETQSALGPALQAAFKLMSPTGGRISVFQTQLPSVGMGALKSREEPNQRATAKVRKVFVLFCFLK